MCYCCYIYIYVMLFLFPSSFFVSLFFLFLDTHKYIHSFFVCFFHSFFLLFQLSLYIESEFGFLSFCVFPSYNIFRHHYESHKNLFLFFSLSFVLDTGSLSLPLRKKNVSFLFLFLFIIFVSFLFYTKLPSSTSVLSNSYN